MRNIEVKDFHYDGAELQKAANDSMLAESGMIAKLDIEVEGKPETIGLYVCGDIRIIYKDEVYKYPSDYPEELTKLINSGKAYNSKDVEIGNNNWVELMWTENGGVVDCFGMDTVVDGEFGSGAPEEAYKYLIDMTKEMYATETELVNITGSEAITF